MNSVQQQEARAHELAVYWFRRMVADSRQSNNHTPEQLLWAIQRVVSRALAAQDKTPKEIGRHAAERAREYKRTKLSKRNSTKMKKAFENIDLSDYPHLVKTE